MRHHLKPLALCAATLALASGCTHTKTAGSTAIPAPSPTAAPAASAPSANPNKGSVAEVIQAGRYSYISVDSGSGTRWFAVPSAELKVGQKVEVLNAMEVKNYNAKSLNRTFESIYFSDKLSVTTAVKDAKGAPSGHSSVGKLAYPGVKKTVSGKVAEVVVGGEFDFLFIETSSGKIWVALPAGAAAQVGQDLSFLPGEEIIGFTSGKVNRTFERIVFTGGVDRKK